MKHSDEFDNDSHRELSAIEQQLKLCRPRTPQLDLVVGVQKSVQSSEVSLAAVADAPTRTGFTATQLATAIAASWLVGAVVGGGCIFYLLNPSSTAVATNETGNRIEQPAPVTVLNAVKQSGNSSLPANVRPQVASEAPTLSAPTLTDFRPRSLFDLDFSSLSSDAQLTVRGLASQEPSPVSGERYVTTLNRSAGESFTPTEPSNRSKLMKDFLSDPNFQIQ